MTRAMVLTLVLATAAPLVARADDGKKVVELSKRGQKLWAKSCKGAHLGACVKRVQVKGRSPTNTGGRCAAGWALRARKRHAARARKAQKLFKKVMDLHTTMGDKAPAEVKAAAAAARFYQADAIFEAHVTPLFPTKLDFASKDRKRAKRSKKAFAEYLLRKSKTLADARAAYTDVIKLKSPRWAVAASARIGQMFQHFSDELRQAPVPNPPVPPSLTEPDAIDSFRKMFTDTYCKTLNDKAGALAKKAQEAFEVCTTQSKGKAVQSDFADYCKDHHKKVKP